MKGKPDIWTMRLLKVYLVLTLALVAVSWLGGCNTAAGIGRDLMGAWDGMLHVAETNGESSRGVRGR